jgi:hypothetical protein
VTRDMSVLDSSAQARTPAEDPTRGWVLTGGLAMDGPDHSVRVVRLDELEAIPVAGVLFQPSGGC